MLLLQLKYPLELCGKSREFLPGSGFLPRRDKTYTVESDVNPNSFHPFQSLNILKCMHLCYILSILRQEYVICDVFPLGPREKAFRWP